VRQERWASWWQAAPAAVRITTASLVVYAMALPLLTGLAFVREPTPLPAGPFSTVQVAALLAVAFVAGFAWLLLLAWMLLQRSRIGWVLAVASGLVTASSYRRAELDSADVVATQLLALASSLPLLAPQSLRWFWQRPSTASRPTPPSPTPAGPTDVAPAPSTPGCAPTAAAGPASSRPSGPRDGRRG
jgi:hypothetical protein